jgi:hypothetical protein
MKALDEYETIKPNIILSHDINTTISSFISNPSILKMFGLKPDMVTMTQDLLEQMFEIYHPKMWIFGHYHKDFSIVYKNTRFMCIRERGYVDFFENWKISS